MVTPYAMLALEHSRTLAPIILIPVTNAIERLHEELKRRIKTQTVLPSAETAAMLFWALLASGQIVMRRVDGWPTLSEKPSDQLADLAA
jgi:putative transposase